MLASSFCSKVNLPRVVDKLGQSTSDYEFIRVPLYGWYAKSKVSPFIGTIFDFFDIKDWRKLYGTICQNYGDCMDFKLPYNPHAEKKLYDDQMRIMRYQSLWVMAKQEAREVTARESIKVMAFKNLLNVLGMPCLLENKFGYLTQKVLKAFPDLSPELEAKFRYKKTLLIPSFSTPAHICSLELAKLDNLMDRSTVFLNGEYGWYGNAGTQIVRDINELKVKVGATWNHKLIYWSPGGTGLSEMLSGEQLIKIWSEAGSMPFKDNLPAMLFGKQGTDDLKNHVAMLTYAQVIELERLSGQTLMPTWSKAREQQFYIHGRTYLKRDKAYYLVRKGGEEQLSNFSLDINQIRKKDESSYMWCGILYFQDQVVPFELEDKYFSSYYLFSRGMRSLFLNLGLGIPFINETHVKHLLTMIQMTSQNVKIVNS